MVHPVHAVAEALEPSCGCPHLPVLNLLRNSVGMHTARRRAREPRGRTTTTLYSTQDNANRAVAVGG